MPGLRVADSSGDHDRVPVHFRGAAAGSLRIAPKRYSPHACRAARSIDLEVASETRHRRSASCECVSVRRRRPRRSGDCAALAARGCASAPPTADRLCAGPFFNRRGNSSPCWRNAFIVAIADPVRWKVSKKKPQALLDLFVRVQHRLVRWAIDEANRQRSTATRRAAPCSGCRLAVGL